MALMSELSGRTASAHYREGRAVVGKLVLDRIPDIIRASGRVPRVTTLDIEDYHIALRLKLDGEVAELLGAQRSDILDEAGDVLEVLIAIVAEHGETLDSIVAVAHRKRAQRGGFEMRRWLDGVDSVPERPSR
jgi:predicted house-cleaning noncanonical NTP pyrophosphatase (MazG superfamily)